MYFCESVRSGLHSKEVLFSISKCCLRRVYTVPYSYSLKFVCQIPCEMFPYFLVRVQKSLIARLRLRVGTIPYSFFVVMCSITLWLLCPICRCQSVINFSFRLELVHIAQMSTIAVSGPFSLNGASQVINSPFKIVFIVLSTSFYCFGPSMCSGSSRWQFSFRAHRAWNMISDLNVRLESNLLLSTKLYWIPYQSTLVLYVLLFLLTR